MKAKKIKGIIFYTLLGVLVLILAIIFFSNHPFDSDEGVSLSSAWDLWNHKTLYSLDMVEYLAPGTSLTIFAVWKAVGISYAAARISGVLLWFFSLIFILLSISKFTKNIFVLLFTILVWFGLFCGATFINHNPFSTFLAAMLFYFYLDYFIFKNRKVLTVLLLSLFSALVFWYLQTKGLALFLLITSLMLWHKEYKNLCLYTIYSLAVTVILFLPSNISNAAQSLFIAPFKLNYLHANSNMFDLKYFTFLLILILGIGIIIYLKDKREYFYFIYFQFALLISSLNNFNFYHYRNNMFPILILLIILFYKANPILFKKIMIPISIFGFVLILKTSLLNLSKDECIFIRDQYEETSRLNLNKFNSIYAGPFLANLYFELRQPNNYPVTHNDVSNEEVNNRIFDEFKKRKPELVFVNYEIVEQKLNYNKNNPLDQYILSNYSNCGKTFADETAKIYAIDKSYCPQD